MGKSPGKWIKTLLFGKKTTRSQSVKGRNASKAGNDKGYTVANGPPLASTENSPVISEPVLVSTHSNVINTELEKGNSSSLVGNTSITSASSQDAENQEITEPVASNNLEKFREEQAATKAQAAFRGFLARKAFHALKGIIRLQALVRGHLVRRQAIVTLRSTLGIIKLQALVRGQKVRSSGTGLEVNAKFCQWKTTVFKISNSRKGKLYTNTFVCKLLSSLLVVMPLQILYDQEEPNSVTNWMERWTFSSFWITPSLPKRNLDTKTQPKKGGYAMETESGRPKRNIRRNSASNAEVGSTNITTELEKPKRNVRKVPSLLDSVQDPPQSELEKVKRNLRKVSSAYAETSERIDSATNTPRNIKKLVDSSADILEQNIEDSAEKAKKDIPVTPQPIPDTAEKAKKDIAVIPQPKPDMVEKAKKDIAVIPQPKPDMEIASKYKDEEVQFKQSIDIPPAVESNQILSTDQEGKNSVVNADVSVKEEQIYSETQKTSKRRASFSAKSESAENGVQNTPTLPSYMQATESAKAKLRRENSPRFASDSAEKNGITRRHSLPSSTNGKVTSSSPRTQKILQAGGKGGIRSDRSLLSSRDGSDKPIQVEWRR